MRYISAFVGSLLCWTSIAHAQTHPRLFFDAADVPALRAKAKQKPWSDMLATADFATTRDSFGNDWFPRPQYQAALHLFLGGSDKSHADKARDAVLVVISMRAFTEPAKDSSLGLGTMGGQVAVAYDLCYDAWAGQTVPATVVHPVTGATVNVAPKWVGKSLNAAVSQALKENGDNLMASGGGGWPGDMKVGNNWHAVRYGGAGLCYLATDDPVDAGKFGNAVSRLAAHFKAILGEGAESRGWNAEGLGYLGFPGQTSMPFLLALKRNTNAALGLVKKDLRDDIPGLKYTLQTQYPAALPIARRHPFKSDFTGRGLRPEFNDDHPLLMPEGTAALAFALAPEEFQPGLKWMFRRFWGDLGDQSWDMVSGHPLWSLLYFPESLQEKNPADVWGLAWKDPSMGMFVLRNRYQDENDTVFQATANLRLPNGGHGGPDDLSFRFWSLGVPWVVGAGRNYDNPVGGQSGLAPEDPSKVTSLVPPTNNSVADSLLRSAGDGYLVLKSDQLQSGVENATRRYVVDHTKSETGAEAAAIVSDSSSNGRFWRLNTPSFNTIATDNTKRTFTITSPDGKTMRGAVIWPKTVTFRVNDKMFERTHVRFPYKDINYDSKATNWVKGYTTGNNWVDFETPDGKAVVVLTVADKGLAQPAITADPKGSGNVQKLMIGKRVFVLDGDSISATGWERPNVTITSPTTNQNYNSGAASIAMSGTAAVPSGSSNTLDRVEIYLDDVKQGNATLSGGSWSYSFPSVAVGSHKLSALAIDSAKNERLVNVTVKINSTVPPNVAITWPSAATTLQSGQIVQFQGTASDPENALNRVEVWADGGKLGNAILTGGQWSYNWSGAKTGVHQVHAIAYDNAGDSTQTDMLPVTLSVRFSNIPKWGDAANYLVAGSFSKEQVNINGSGRWSVVDLDGDLRLKVRPVQNYDYHSHVAWLTGTDVTGKGNWRLSYKFKTGDNLATNPESFVFFGAGTDAPMTLDLRPTNGVMPATHPTQESGTRVWHRLNSGPLVGVAWSLGAVTHPATPGTDHAGIPNAGWNDVRVDRVGKTLKVYVNNSLILDGYHALLGTKGRIGLGNWRPYGTGGAIGYFDDINFVPLDAAGVPLAETPATSLITEPATDGAGYAVGSAIAFSGTVTDVDTPASVELYLGGTKIGDAVLTGSGASRSWTLSPQWAAVAGTYSLSVKTTDGLGNVAWPAARTFRVGSSANVPP